MKTESKNKILKLYVIITNYTDMNRNDDISNLDWNSLNESNMEIYTIYKFNIKETFVLKKLIYKYINNYQCELSEDAIIGYDYISYNGIDFQTYDGTIILTYLVYNPNTTYTDDIIERYDFCLDREFED